MTLTAAYGLVTYALLCGAMTTFLHLGEYRHRVAMITTGLCMIGIAPGLHGAFGTPSLTLLLLALLRLAGSPLPWPLSLRPAQLLLGVAAVFYPLALGLGSFDPYALGYQPMPLLVALTPLAAALWWRRQDIWLGILTLDLLAYGAGIFPNLWDALFDPLLILLAIYQIIRQQVRNRRINARAIR